MRHSGSGAVFQDNGHEFTIPPAFVPVGTCYAYPYGGGKYTLRWGIVAAIVSIVITVALIYPLGSLVG